MAYHSYMAGLNFTESQALNGLVCVTLASSFYFSFPSSDFRKNVWPKAGKVIHMPPGNRGAIITVIQDSALFAPVVTCLVSTPLNRFVTPGWLAKLALPPTSPEFYYSVRIGSCVGVLGAGAFMVSVLKHLGAQWHFIGVRERHEVVNTGPYRFVRHPMYSCAMLLEVLFAGAFWSWMPLPALGILAAALAIKMPMEEQLILGHDKIGKEYIAYKRQVPWRVIPYIW